MARQLGVNTLTVTNWELGHTPPDLPFIPKIIQFLGYTHWDGKARNPGERLKAHRWAGGLTQEEMARRLGVDPGTLARWEGGAAHKREQVSCPLSGSLLKSSLLLAASVAGRGALLGMQIE